MYRAGDARVCVGPGLGRCLQPHGLIEEDTNSQTVGQQVRLVYERDPICSAYKLMAGCHVAFRKLNLQWNETFIWWRLGLTHSQDLLLVRMLTGHSSRPVFLDAQTCMVKSLFTVTCWRSLFLLFHVRCNHISKIACATRPNVHCRLCWDVYLKKLLRLKSLSNEGSFVSSYVFGR